MLHRNNGQLSLFMYMLDNNCIACVAIYMHSVCLYVWVHVVCICISMFAYLAIGQVIQLLGSLFLHITYIGLVILFNIYM